ncbi:putative Golgi apparatus membrane protein TVP23 [Blattamonas nauphoetae]|uniref:Golgi apparatus membrane protein TVP23 homolog n=1 Tax=Blattamonas nauphoetae TaxID=2049346 RepID=A0ABQ9YFC3_9EUKA|nr:putative Golgi apparatus membrane protein TVP23 [Blattamonas nauphoetae]
MLPSMDEEPLAAKNHPVVIVFYFLFKVLSYLMYLFGSLFKFNFVITFVLEIVFFSCDFWITKNIAGRFLVGYRWWSAVGENGETTWRFEALQDRSCVKKRASSIFWITLWASTIIWALASIGRLFFFNFNLFFVTITGTIFCGINLIGYLRCSRVDPKKVLTEYTTKLVAAQAAQQVSNQISSLTGADQV